MENLTKNLKRAAEISELFNDYFYVVNIWKNEIRFQGNINEKIINKIQEAGFIEEDEIEYLGFKRYIMDNITITLTD